MTEARAKAQTPGLLHVRNRAVPAEKDAIVCPEGKEWSPGTRISTSTVSLSQQGLGLATNGFKMIFPKNRFMSRAIHRAIPQYLYLLVQSSTKLNKIQNQPASPRKVKKAINLSNTGPWKVWIRSKTENSQSTVMHSPFFLCKSYVSYLISHVFSNPFSALQSLSNICSILSTFLFQDPPYYHIGFPIFPFLNCIFCTNNKKF